MNKNFIYLAMIAVCLSGYLAYKKIASRPYGMVIVLNGPSGSGKTTLQKEFQKIMMPQLWVKLGIDSLFDLPMPDITLENMQYWQSFNDIRWVDTFKDPQGHNVIKLEVGKQGQKVAYAMNSAIAAYAKNGCNVIVDYIAYDQAWLKDLALKLAGIKVYYVAVKIPLDVLEEREKARGTSPQGHARSHYDSVYGDRKYDLEVDSSKYNMQEISKQLKNMILR